jgi:hypothetical protein
MMETSPPPTSSPLAGEEGVRRTAVGRRGGLTVLHFWNNEILTNPEGVATAILAALAPPLPNPLPQGERGQKDRP